MAEFIVNPIGKTIINEEGMFIALDQQYIPALAGLEGFGCLEILWWFSDFDNAEARSVRTTPKPYKNGPEVMGIFATRSPVRPNPIALSTVQVIGIDYEKGIIEVAYIDAYDGTPVLDIKPYTPSTDRAEEPAVPGWCTHWPKSAEVSGNFEWENEFNF